MVPFHSFPLHEHWIKKKADDCGRANSHPPLIVCCRISSAFGFVVFVRATSPLQLTAFYPFSDIKAMRVILRFEPALTL
jgi:hypothetical protein